MKLNRKVKLIPFLLWILIILVVSSWPSLKSPETGIFEFDKLAHMGQYFIAGLLLFYYLYSTNLIIRILYIRFSFLALFSVADEFHQLFIPGRGFSLFDALANLVGVFFSLLISLFVLKRLCYIKSNKKRSLS